MRRTVFFGWGILVGIAGGAAVSAEPEVTVRQSECLPWAQDDRADLVRVVMDGCTVRVLHEYVVTNCCLEYRAKVSVSGSSVEVHEVDEGPPCDCICPYDLETRIDGLESGRYTVVVHAFLHKDPLEFEVEVPPCEGFWLLAPQIWAVMGTSGVTVPVLATLEMPIEGFSFGVTFPQEHARIVEIDLAGTATEEAGAEYVRIELSDPSSEPAAAGTGWATCAVVLDAEEPFEGQTIPAGAGLHLASLVYDILPPGASVPRSVSVPFVDGLGEPPVKIAFSVDGRDVVPETRNGIIQLTSPPRFLRGDSDDDGELTISDPIYLLNFLFQGGSATPCDDAADSNDDGVLDISDAVAALSYLFLGGPMPPPEGAPGIDPTLDELGCARPSPTA